MKKIAATIGLIMLALILVKTMNISYPIDIRHHQDTQGDFMVRGNGEVEVVPDVAQVGAGITVSLAKSAESARERMTQVNNRLVAQLKALGIAEADIKTEYFTVNPEYDYNYYPSPVPFDRGEPVSSGSGFVEGARAEEITDITIQNSKIMPIEPNSPIAPPGFGQDQGRIMGYSGNISLSIKIRNKDNVSKVINAITASGANQVGSVQYVVDDMDAFKDKARELAIKDAKERAKKIAKQAGMRLGEVTNVIEDGGYGGAMYDTYAMSAKAESAPYRQQTEPDIQEGTQNITARVTLYFERK